LSRGFLFMKFILFDDINRYNLLPFAHTRAIADIRCGILTMRERWELYLKEITGTLTESYLQGIYPALQGDDKVYINGSVFANPSLATAIANLRQGQKLCKNKITIAARFDKNISGFEEFNQRIQELPSQEYEGEIYSLNHIWDIFSFNDRVIRDDFALLTKGKQSSPIPANIIVTGKENLFIEEGANVYAGCIINASAGPVYIAKGAEVLEGAMLRGPLALCEQSVVKMGAKLYGATTIGPGCKVGGEINNAVLFANSNKAHDGYLGNAVVGEWCNLGADTNCSNLKNNYDEIKVWDEQAGKSVNTGLIFCGLFIGDHSKCGINTMFNTGTVVGVSANIFGAGFPDKFIPSFCWGGIDAVTTYDFGKAMQTADRMMGRRHKKLSEAETDMYRYIFEHTQSQRPLPPNDN